ncbi:MAG TPA: molybdopterin-dependent oxidoreductase [Candidatus Baltobacteraceae bacterium]|jgi:DMSO/TMAO reductase YedYZ molybdopterin-dependent catalytic subunit
MKRQLFIATSIAAALAGCAPIGTKLNENTGFHKVLDSAEGLDKRIIGTHGLAKEYRPQDISADFPLDSLPTPTSAYYTAIRKDGFHSYSLIVNGAVDRSHAFALAQLEKMATARDITRHDCVEGWSAIAQWDGVKLADVLAVVRPRADARYVVFHCMDSDQQGSLYYESLSLEQAMHPQALLALRMNGKPITPDHGAPVRLRVPTQLGYKSAKWVHRIEVVASMHALYSGNGGYWEDQGYEWYAGI